MHTFKRIAVIIISVVSFNLIILDSGAFADLADDEDSLATLRGIKRILLLFEDLDPEIEADGLQIVQVQSKTEKKLRNAGIEVTSKDQWEKLSKKKRKKFIKKWTKQGGPYLFVKPHFIKASAGSYVYFINIELYQRISLERKKDINSDAITWARSLAGSTHRIKHVRSKIEEIVDEFVNAYLSVNQKGKSEQIHYPDPFPE